MSSRFNEGKVVIVIGVGGGIGCEIVLVLVDFGVWVVINDIGVLLQGEGGLVLLVEEIFGLICQ